MLDIDRTNEKIDLKETINSNAIGLIICFAGIIFLSFYIATFQRIINTFELPEMKVIASFVMAYSVIKGLFEVTPSITIVLKGNIK